MVPQIVQDVDLKTDQDSTNYSPCLGVKTQSNVTFYRLNQDHSQCCSDLYQKPIKSTLPDYTLDNFYQAILR